MAVYSMTGYASVQSEGAETTVSATIRNSPASRLGLEIRSVNSRFLDLAFRLPDDWREHESTLRECMLRQLKRGKVEVRVHVNTGEASALSDPSARLLQRLNALQDNIRTWLPDAAALSVQDVLRLSATESNAKAQLEPELLPLAERALTALMKAREREGARLATMLQERLASLRELSARAVPLVPQVVEAQRQRFLDRWAEALAQTGDAVPPAAAQERAMAEALAYAIRLDVSEEITRLNSHLDEIGRLLSKGGEVGKRLEFLIQELQREANTLGSKSAALEMTRISVDMKVLIEQMREQVQNIE